MKKLALLLLIIYSAYGCATANAGFATSNIPIAERKYKVIGSVEKEKGWVTLDFAIIGIPLKKPPVSSLLDEALKEKNADALVNIRYWNDRMIFFFITWNRMGLTAEAVKFD
ncbi:MAG TPA: hypothetical protein PK453_06935 [Leptospiraceae bacterium]|nr:hypothetical protein [Leptospiraceae bacterium]HMY66579.1 hypothetical protein [Leptospiraceae bacterium]HNF13386.1 hypothetical protein [Leptospiraceae bacterium]HNI94987.1 hypothetical protein [Leptospiraceae bacterium]HNM05812.1 hypothetical protein [Leptospiraceae bacterium]